MSSESKNGPDLGVLTIRLQPSNLSVSYLSSLLRVVQAAVREVARNDDGTRPEFDRNPPVSYTHLTLPTKAEV